MSKSNVQPSTDNKMLDAVVVTLAILIAVAGVLAFTFLSDESLGVRLAALFGGLILACVVGYFSPTGKSFIGYYRSSYDELRRVVWPTRKETINTTGLVMAFVVAVAFYLFVVDMFVEWGLYDGLLRLTF